MNGANLGELDFTGQNAGNVTLPIPRAILQNVNTVTLTAQGGADDLSLVDRVDLNLHSTVGFTEIHCRGRGPGCHSRLRSVTHAPG